MTSLPFNIVHLFFDQALRVPDQWAICYKDEKITFQQLDHDVRIIASMYRQNGIGKGDRVLVLIPMSADLYRHVLALFYIGAVAVFLDAWSDRKRLLHACQLAECKALVGAKKFHWLSYLFSATRKISKRFPVVPSKKYDKVCDCIIEDTYPDDPALITFTTGSTGIPKAANRTHAFLQAQLEALKPLLMRRGPQPDMPLLPIVLLLNLGLGKTSVIADINYAKPSAFDPALLFNTLQTNHVGSLCASPSQLMHLARFAEQHASQLALQTIFTGGGPVYPAEASFYQTVFSQASISIVYGSTEAEPIASIPAQELAAQTYESLSQQGLLVGKPDASVQLQLMPLHAQPQADSWHSLACPSGSPGSIWVSGAHVLRSYWKWDHDPQTVVVDGLLWRNTGDAGRIDAEGNLYLLGRSKYTVEHNGKLFFPLLTEALLKSFPGIQEACYLMTSKGPCVFAQTSGKLDVAAFEKFIAMHGLGTRYVFLDLPKDPRHHTKIDYEALLLKHT
ncbi:MAG: AMP-binding protein [Cytophagaceae bacterium]|jgi:acyl-CoA synthetase (AMP-forming)/AMP-acid ligase II|nr:AMP-binding protein [Cytophagaceae bacterium]